MKILLNIAARLILCLGSILLAIGVLIFGPEWFINIIGEMRKEWFNTGK
jgi:hypothetical protein